MPLLTREYPNQRFGAATVRAAYDSFKRSIGNQVPEHRNSRVLIDGTWQRFTDAEACFEALTAETQSAELDVKYKTASFLFAFDEARTTVAIALPSRAAASSVAAIFDTAAGGVSDRQSVFVGHGRDPAWMDLSDFLASQPDLSVRTYENSVAAGVTSIELLEQLSTQVDFAVFVHTCDSEPDGRHNSPSPNVVHETGFFQGALGRHRTLVVRERGCPGFDNIAGLHEVSFEPASIEGAFEQILRLIRTTIPGGA